MANVTNQAVGGTTGYGVGVRQGSQLVVAEIDIAAAVADGLATTNQIDVLYVPANSFVEVLQAVNTSALSLGGSPDVEFGDSIIGGSSDDDRFVASHSTLTNGSNHTIAAAGAGYLYTLPAILKAKITGDAVASGTVRYVVRITDTNAADPFVAPAR